MMHGFVKRAGTATAVGLLAVTTLAACGGGGSDAVSNAIDKATNGKVKVDKNGNQITIKDKNGSGSATFGGGTELPKGFPKSDVPLPKGGELQAAISPVNRNGKQAFSLSYAFGSSDDLEQAADDYKSALEDAGFTIKDGSKFTGSSGSFSAFQATGTDWDVLVVGGGGNSSGSGDAGVLNATVTTHDSSTDTTDTTG